MFECISAISTASGASGVAIIRLSGENCFEIASKMFKSKTNFNDFEPYKLYTGYIDCGDFTDFGMCVKFKAPKSYTGEDMVEFHCHGGIAITKAVLTKTFDLGARPALNGEFTKRAFLNGKMSLSACEGLIDMINAESNLSAKCGFYLYREKLLKTVLAMQDELTNILASIDVDIDYPEDDVPSCDKNQVKSRLFNLKNRLNDIISTYDKASKVNCGVKVAICGKPNVGKSSLLNALLQCDRAIVTSVPGTTRDVVEGTTDINGVKFTFFDTAGIRESSDEVEKIGIVRSYSAINEGDVVLFLADGSCDFDEEDKIILDKIKDFNYISVLTKSDISKINNFKADIEISSKNNLNIDELKQLIYQKSSVAQCNFDGDFLTTQRHYYAIKDAVNFIDSALYNIEIMPLDIITVDIKSAWDKLGLISGLNCEQEVVDEIFSKFCVGK